MYDASGMPWVFILPRLYDRSVVEGFNQKEEINYDETFTLC